MANLEPSASPEPQLRERQADQADRADQLETATASASNRKIWRYIRIGAFVVMVIALVFWAADWMRTSFLYVHETDARIVTDLITVSSRVSGRITALPIRTGMKMEKGDLIAALDDRAELLALKEAEAVLDGINAEQQSLLTERGMVDEMSASRMQAGKSELDAASALVESFGHEFTYSRQELERADKLVARGILPKADRDRLNTAFLKAQQNLLRSQAERAMASAKLTTTEAERRELDLIDRRSTRLSARKAEQEARIAQIKLQIENHRIESTLNGVISRIFINPGEYVQAGERIALIHNPDDIWVEARIRETEIRRLSVGQEVDVRVDAYPDDTFSGKIERIGHAATSEFALLPSPNPSGNFTKVTQRLPVRIAIDQRDGKLRPGMMVEVYVDIDAE